MEKSPIFIFTLSFRIMYMGVELAGLHVLAFILINRFENNLEGKKQCLQYIYIYYKMQVENDPGANRYRSETTRGANKIRD
jgi:hypothetical protein